MMSEDQADARTSAGTPTSDGTAGIASCTPPSRGLLDGFAPYATPRDDDYRDVLRHGLVVVDTNTLLNLYRYHEGTRADLFTILEAFGDRLFIPHEVATEFWRNREAAIRDAANAASELVRDLDRQTDQSVQSLAAWAERAGLPRDRMQRLQSVLRDAYGKVAKQVQAFDANGVRADAVDTNEDPILVRLIRGLDGLVGQPFSDQLRAEHEQEAKRRIDGEQPPGYRDKEKRGTGWRGDYFVWRQLLDEARHRQLDVLLVTGDLKEDWWRREKGETRGPRIELSTELFLETGQRLLMVRPAGLLARAKDALDLKIRKESVEAAERVDRYSYDRERRQYYAAAELYPLVKLPEGRQGGYLETLIDMTSLAQDEPPYEEFVASFQRAFPNITRVDEARRRLGILRSLDLLSIQNNRARLTKHGIRLLADRSLDVLQEQFMRRIAGATDVKARAATTPIPTLRLQLQEEPPEGTSPTQANLVLLYLEGLELI